MYYPLDLPTLIIHQMQEAITKRKENISYAMPLTLVFKNAGSDLENGPNRVLHHSDTYNKGSLN